MKTILVPTDFSECAAHAIDYAVELAQTLNAKIVLHHSFMVPVIYNELQSSMPDLGELERSFNIRLEKISEKIREKHNGITIENASGFGIAVNSIISVSVEKKADVIVMGMRGAGKIEKILIGSTASSVIRDASKPVLVIPEKAKFKPIKKIVFAIDYENQSDFETPGILKDIAHSFKSKLLVLNVVKDKISAISSANSAFNLDHKLEGIDHEYFFLENRNTLDGINDFITSHDADLVVIVPREYSFIERLLQRTNTHKMVFHSKMPLLTIPS